METKPKTTWGVGDYPEMAERLVPVAEHAAEVAGVRRGTRVLDVGCGTGNFARVAAGLGAEATGLDGEPALLAVARSLDRGGSSWRESDFGSLDAADRSFDVVASIFGVMYAPDHRAALAELRRVRASDGTIVLCAWTPDGLMPSLGRAMGPFLPPPPPNPVPPGRWGDADALGELLAGAGLRLSSAEVRDLPLSFADAAQATAFFIRTAGHALAERDRLLAEGRWEQLERAVEEVVEERATATPSGIELPARYLLATARP